MLADGNLCYVVADAKGIKHDKCFENRKVEAATREK